MTQIVAESEAARSSKFILRGPWVLAVTLFLAGVVSAIDRGILNLVIDPVRHDLHITDVQISLLQGLSYSLFFATIGIPLGVVADRVQRRLLLVAGITLWSLATILGGLAPTYGWMFASRLLVGVGEATLGPCALSMISDAFPPDKRGKPMGLHMLGSAISSGLAVMLVSSVLGLAARGAFDFFPHARGAAPWRAAFVVAGCIGFFVAAVLAAQREPRRRGIVMGAGEGLGLKRSIEYLVENKAVFLPFYVAFALVAIGAWAVMGWSAVLLMRQFHLVAATLGKTLGVVSIIAGVIGAIAPGVVIDLRAKRQNPLFKNALLACLPVIGLPAAFAVFAPNGMTAIFMLASVTLLFPMLTVIIHSVIADVMPNNMRAVGASLLGLSSSVIGSISGPLLVATATERLFHSPIMVGYSILLVAAPAMILGALAYTIAYFNLKANLAKGGSLAAVMSATY